MQNHNCTTCKYYECHCSTSSGAYVKCQKRGTFYVFENRQGSFRHKVNEECYEPSLETKLLEWFLRGGCLLVLLIFFQLLLYAQDTSEYVPSQPLLYKIKAILKVKTMTTAFMFIIFLIYFFSIFSLIRVALPERSLK